MIGPLEGFYYVARHRGFTRAAENFPYPITQPGVFKQVKGLEQELGVELFRRAGRDRMELTPEGELLFAHVAPFLEGLPAVLQSMRRGEPAGPLAIEAAPLVLRQLLPDWVREIRKRLPLVQVRLQERDEHGLQRLRGGEVDCSVDYFKTLPAGIETRRVAEARAYLVTPKGLRRSELSQTALVGYPEDLPHARLQRDAVRSLGLSYTDVVSARTADSILGIVQAGIGYSVVPWLAPGGPRLAGVTATRLAQSKAKLPIHVAWKKSPGPSRALRAALDLLP